jgi:hypothetical protein
MNTAYGQQSMEIIKSSDPDKIIVHKGNMNIMINRKEFGRDANIIYFDSTCLLVGLSNIPYFLQIQPQVEISKIPNNLYSNFIKVRLLDVSKAEVLGEVEEHKFFATPTWIVDFVKLEYLRLDHLE